MNILYIHGLDSFPHPERLEVLQNNGHKTYALHLDYQNEPKTFSILEKYALENQVDFIIGSSAGGYIGYWLGHHLNIPQLLFNPAVTKRNIREDVGFDIPVNQNLSSFVVLGVQDDVVPHDENVSFFKDMKNVKMVSCHWLAHQIDLQTFQESVIWAGL
jgi:hypothetical protein